MWRAIGFIVTINFVFGVQAQVRTWSDASGKYHFKGQLLASSETAVILEKGNKDLVSIDIDQLSEADRDYLKKSESDAKFRTWTTRNGLHVRASLVEFVRRDITVHRLRGKVYVNDTPFANLPGVYRKIVPKIVNHFENNDIHTQHEFLKWGQSLKGDEKKYTFDGLLLELEGGDLYAVPWFLISSEDLARVKPDLTDWQKADDAEARAHFSLSAQGHAQSTSRRTTAESGDGDAEDVDETDEKEARERERRQVAKMRFQLEAYDANLFDLWEVALFGGGLYRTIVVPATNSNQARAAVVTRYPNWRITGVRKVPRNY